MTRHRTFWALLTVASFVLAFATLVSDSPAADSDTPDIPADTCILELNLPADATITVDGRDYGTRRRFTFPSLQPGKKYKSKLRVTYADGQKEEQAVRIEGGSLVRKRFKHGRPELVWQIGDEDAFVAALTPDCRYLATGGVRSGGVTLWDVEKEQVVRTFDGCSRGVESIAFSPDGKQLACAYERRVILFDKVTGAIVFTIEIEPRSVGFSPDSTTLAISASPKARGETTLWDTTSGEQRRTLRVDEEYYHPTIALFGPKGKHILTADDRTAVLWNAKPVARAGLFG